MVNATVRTVMGMVACIFVIVVSVIGFSRMMPTNSPMPQCREWYYYETRQPMLGGFHTRCYIVVPVSPRTQ